MTRSIPLDVAIAEAEKSGFLSIEDLQRLASPQPANPAQVTDAIRGIVEDALNSAIPEPWEVAEHATQRILAAIGAGGQPIDRELRDAAKAMGAEVARDVPMVGAGGQAVAEEDALETIERELIDGLEVEISIGSESYTFNHRQLARRILSALSQPHPADERVVEALRECADKLNIARIDSKDEVFRKAAQYALDMADAALSTAPATADGWRDMSEAPNNDTIIVRWDDDRIEIVQADDNDFDWQPYPGKDDYCSRPIGWLPMSFLPAAPTATGGR